MTNSQPNNTPVNSACTEELITDYKAGKLKEARSFLEQYNQALGEGYSVPVDIIEKEDVDDDHYPLLDQHIPNGLKAIYKKDNFIHSSTQNGDDAHFALCGFTIPSYWLEDAFLSGQRLGAEIYRALGAQSAMPVGLQLKISLGNQAQKTEIIADFLAGLDEACKALNLASSESGLTLKLDDSTFKISVCGIGVIEAATKPLASRFKGEDQHIYVLGREHGHLGLSAYINDAHQRQDGGAPSVYFEREIQLTQFIQAMHKEDYLTACQSVSIGGIGLALAQMGKPSNIGASVGGIGNASFWYGEDQARFVVTIKTAEMAKFEVAAQDAGISLLEIGNTEEDSLGFNNQRILLSELSE